MKLTFLDNLPLLPRRCPTCLWVLIAAVLLAALPARPAEPEPGSRPELKPEDLPRVPPTPASKALDTFRIKPGFRIEIAAAEPLVMDPIALAFDEHGRMFVVEMRDYSERRDERLGRIKLLEDVDGDGRFDKGTVYADDLPWPTAVLCYDGGVFVGASPDILYFKDTDGDGKADVRRRVFSGFGAGQERLNVQQLLNSFTWGIDNRIHGATGGNGGTITRPEGPQGQIPVELRARDFSFDPKTLSMSPESGGGQYGLTFDAIGRKFVCSNSAHLQMLMFEARYAGRNPLFPMPSPLINIAADGPAAEVFRISPDEPWRVIRTQWRVAGKVPGPIEGGGRPSGYFTAATGITIYKGDAWPEEYRGNAFIADAGSNLIHRKRLVEDGLQLLGMRADAEKAFEFLASTDNWFRPVQMANGPDGNLYVLDMYREIIEHPWSLPPPLKERLDLNSGNDRGRIYRIVHEDGEDSRPDKRTLPGSTDPDGWIRMLEHPNGWHRETASRLLYEKADPSTIPGLTELLRRSKSPLARLHALHLLSSLGHSGDEVLLHALSDPDSAVRRHAVRLCSKPGPPVSPPARPLWDKLLSLGDDPDPHVRYQLAFTLGDFTGSDRLGALARILRKDIADPWIRAAALSSLRTGAAELFGLLVKNPDFYNSRPGLEFLRQLAGQIAAESAEQTGGARVVLDFLQNVSDPLPLFTIAAAWLERSPGSVRREAAKADSLQRLYAKAEQIITDEQTPEAARVEAAKLIGALPPNRAAELLLPLLTLETPPALQLAAGRSLSRFDAPEIIRELVRRWPRLTPALRNELLNDWLKSASKTSKLLDFVESNQIRAGDLSGPQIQLLRSHRDASIQQRAEKLFPESTAENRAALLSRFMPALELRGNPSDGRAIFAERCASCHRIGTEGYPVGPELASVRSNGKPKLLANIIDPNLEVPPQFITYVVETRQGESHSGIVAQETASTLTLRQAFGAEVHLPRADVVALRSTGLSAMPEGLEAGLSLQQMADLLEFVFAGE